MTSKSFIGLSILLFASCAGPDLRAPFNTDWQNDRGTSIARVERSLRSSPPPPSINVVVGLDQRSIVGLPLDRGKLWEHAAMPDTLPAIAGPLVVYTQSGKATALDAATGEVRWTVDTDDYRLRGAGDDGERTLLSLGLAGGAAKSLLLAVTRKGSVSARVETDQKLGRPAARGGVGFVPWGAQYVSAIDLSSGREVGRLLTRELTSHALSVGPELFFGEQVVTRFDENAQFASTKQDHRTSLPKRILPGKPRWLPPGGELPALETGARARIRLVALPRWTGTEVRFASHRFLATYFRTVMAFDAKSAELSWVRALPEDVIEGAAARSGFVLCLADGQVVRFSATGGSAGSVKLGRPLRACVVEADTLVVPAGDEPGTLSKQLEAALESLDPEMAAAQRFLITELARLDRPEVAKTLIELSTNHRIPPDVRAKARELLSKRRSGAEFMLTALDRHYDFLSGALPPPVGPLAVALGAMRETRGAPLLARHLNDPATDAKDVEQAAEALFTLATPQELGSLETFLALYRATADEPSLVQAVAWVARAILRVGGESGRALVLRAARDPLTRPAVSQAIVPFLSTATADAPTAKPAAPNAAARPPREQ